MRAGGWERGLPAETETTRSQNHVKKRGAYPPSSARCVGLDLLPELTASTYNVRIKGYPFAEIFFNKVLYL